MAAKIELGGKIDILTKFVRSMTIIAMIGMLGGLVIYFVYSVTPKS